MSNLIHVVLFLIFSIHQALTELNITYINLHMSWVDANDYCFNNGGLLESNYTELITYNAIDHTDFWLGTYSDDGWSKWSLYWGCYMMVYNQTDPNYVIVKNKIHCQENCSQYQFFAFKDTKCYCFDVLPAGTSDSSLCQCNSCLPIFKHNIGEFERGLGSLDTPEHLLTCLSAQCEGQKLKLTSEDCTHSFEGICETNGTSVGYGTQSDASFLCRMKYNSHLKWYTSDFCQTNNDKFNKLWTRATRQISTYNVRKQDRNGVMTPACCQYLSHSFDLDIIPKTLRFTTCEARFTFFCRFSISFDVETTTETSTAQTAAEPSTPQTTAESSTPQNTTFINTVDSWTSSTSLDITETSSATSTWSTESFTSNMSSTEAYLAISGVNSLVTAVGYVSGIVLLMVAIFIIVFVLKHRQKAKKSQTKLHDQNLGKHQSIEEMSVVGSKNIFQLTHAYVHPTDVYVDIIPDTNNVIINRRDTRTGTDNYDTNTNYKVTIEKTDLNTSRYSRNDLYSVVYPLPDVTMRNERTSTASNQRKHMTVESIYDHIADDASVEQSNTCTVMDEKTKEVRIHRKSVDGVYSEVDFDFSSVDAHFDSRRTMSESSFNQNVCRLTPAYDISPNLKLKSTGKLVGHDSNYDYFNEQENYFGKHSNDFRSEKTVHDEWRSGGNPSMNFTKLDYSVPETRNETYESQYEHNFILKSTCNNVDFQSKIKAMEENSDQSNCRYSSEGQYSMEYNVCSGESPYDKPFVLITGNKSNIMENGLSKPIIGSVPPYAHNVISTMCDNVYDMECSRKGFKTNAESPYEHNFTLTTVYNGKEIDGAKKQIGNTGSGYEKKFLLTPLGNLGNINNGVNMFTAENYGEKDTEHSYDQILPIDVVSVETYDRLNEGEVLFTADNKHLYEKTPSRNDRRSVYDTTNNQKQSPVPIDSEDLRSKGDYSKLNLSIRRRQIEGNNVNESYEKLHEGTDRHVTTDTSLYDKTASVKAEKSVYDQTKIHKTDLNNKEHFVSELDYTKLNVTADPTTPNADISMEIYNTLHKTKIGHGKGKSALYDQTF